MAQELRFILDVHLGRLAKYLRLCGFDTLYSSHFSDPEIIEISVRDGRIVLTRDKLLLKDKRINRGYRIISQNHEEQMREVFEEFNLRNHLNLFCRCIRCNTPLEVVDKKDILHRIQANTTRYYSSFSRCPNCDRIYWDGSHYNNMKKFIAGITKRLE
ncbi:MAG: Mut7-C RNAse domain-containing protein [Bacteroidales bacterium]|jgi:hypothetical protein|nr:Mut7-C RNAse domain-containing protein [Bacteroidales bacterium]